MNLQPFYCYICTRQFMNAASVIRYRVRYDAPDTNDERWIMFHERGYSAIEHLHRIRQEAEADGKIIEYMFNDQAGNRIMMYATVMVRGTGYCTGHLYEAEQHWIGSQGMRRPGR